MLVYAATSAGSPQLAWRLIAEPDRWHEWAPHIRGARGLGRPEVEAGRSGFVRLLSGVRVPARITGKQPGQWWDWRVGLVDMRHGVEASEGGCRVRVELRATPVVELALRATYGPLTCLMVRNLASVTAEATGGRHQRPASAVAVSEASVDGDDRVDDDGNVEG